MTLIRLFALKLIRAKFKILTAISKKNAAREAFILFCTPPTRETRALPPVFREAEELELKFGEHRVVGYRWNRGKGEKVLINHGFESTAINFEAYVGPLITKGYEVIMFDAPAHGRSSGRRINTMIYKEMILAIHEKFGPVRKYLGHSLGGLSVSIALAEMPHDNQFRLVLIAPATNSSTAVDNFFSVLRLSSALRPFFVEVLEKAGGHPLSWFTVTRAMEHIRAAVLWMHDEEDSVTPVKDIKQVIEKNYPNIEFVFTKGLGHSKIYRDQAVISRAVKFL